MCQDPIMPGFGHLMSASHEITRLSVCLSVCQSVSLISVCQSQDWIINFF